MENNDYISLIHKSLTGQITVQEKAILEQWLANSHENQIEFQEINSIWNAPIEEECTPADDDFAALQTLEGNVATLIAKEGQIQRLKKLLWITFSIGSISLLCVLYLCFRGGASREARYVLAASEPTTILLSDSSLINIKSSSVLTCIFSQNKREVQLQGEALFTIAAEDRPFIVHVADAVIRIKGTTFHLRALPGKPLGIVVVSGDVEVNLAGKIWRVNAGNYLCLKDGTQSVITRFDKFNSDISFSNVLQFEKAPLREVIDQIEEKYSISCFLPVELHQCTFTGTLEQATLADVIRILSYSMRIEFKGTGRNTYYITGTGCDS